MLFLLRRKKLKEASQAEVDIPTSPIPPRYDFRIQRSFSSEDINRVKSQLRLTSVEREILGEALTRVYDAAAAGRITVDERDRLGARYKDQLVKLDAGLTHDKQVLSLHELEETRNELMKMFDEKFSQLNNRIDGIRHDLGVIEKEKPLEKQILESISLTSPTGVTEGEGVSESRKPGGEVPPEAGPVVKKRRADEELKKMVEELQGRLQALEQMELEG